MSSIHKTLDEQIGMFLSLEDHNYIDRMCVTIPNMGI